MFFVFIFLELIIFSLFSDQYGFLQTLGYYLLPSILGFILLIGRSATALTQLHVKLMSGQRPDKVIFQTAVPFLAGVLLLAPFFITRVMGILILLPGSRHLIYLYMLNYFSKKFKNSNFYSFTIRTGDGGEFNRKSYRENENSNQSGYSNTGDHESENFRTIKDAEVIDVKPIKIERKD